MALPILQRAGAWLSRMGGGEGGAAVTRSTDSSLAAPQPWLLGILGALPSSTGIPVTPLTALQSAVVYGCVRCLGEDLAKLPLQVRRRLPGGGTAPAPEHRLSRLLRRPCRWMTAYDFWAYMVTALSLRGNAYAVALRNNRGEVTQLVPVSPDRVTLLLSPTGALYYMIFHPALGAGHYTFSADDLLHIRGMSLDGYVGISPIAAAQDAIGLALATQTHGGTMFRQGATVPHVITAPGTVTPEARQRIVQTFLDNQAGLNNVGKPALLDAGMKLERIALTSEEAQYLAVRQFQVNDICRVFRVPPHKVMNLERATFSNIENQNQQYIDDALMPNAVRIEQHAEELLLFEDERDEYELRFDFDQLLRGDYKTRMEGHQIALLNGIKNRNEVRAGEGMAPVEGGDVFRVPLNTGVPEAPKPDSTPAADAVADAEGAGAGGEGEGGGPA